MSNPAPSTKQIDAYRFVADYKSEPTAQHLRTTVCLDADLAAKVAAYLRRADALPSALVYAALKKFLADA